MATQPGMTATAAARDLGLERSVLRRWVLNAEGGRTDLTPGRSLKSDSQAEFEQLRRELARVKMERDVFR
nr:transposase [Aromatoleum petrolei]